MLAASVLSLLLAVTLEAFPPQWPALHDLDQECVDIPEREIDEEHGTHKRDTFTLLNCVAWQLLSEPERAGSFG